MRPAQLDRLLSRLENGVAALALGAATILSVAGVILRYLFDYVIFWSEEASLYLVVLSTFVGASIALRHKDHVGVDLLALVVPGRTKKLVHILGMLVVVVYCGLLGFVGWVMVTSPVSRSFETPSLGLPLWLVQAAVPVGLTLMLFRALQILYRTIRDLDPYPDAPDARLVEDEPVV